MSKNYLYILTCALLLSTSCATAHADGNLFGSKEKRSTRLKSFPKWTDLLDRYKGDIVPSGQCKTDCTLKQLNSFLAGLKGKSQLTKLKEVNQFLNKRRYITDPINWGIPDYWATPHQFKIKNGDCEDYAISKYLSLKTIGFDPKDMRVVVLMDHNLGIHHSVLSVNVEGKNYILDNQIQQVMLDSQIYHYQPIYSINESYWWRHR